MTRPMTGPGMGTASARAIVSPASWQTSRMAKALSIAVGLSGADTRGHAGLAA